MNQGFVLTLTLVLITPQMRYSWYYLSHTATHWDETFRLLLAVIERYTARLTRS